MPHPFHPVCFHLPEALIAKLPNFEFLLYRIILFGFNGFKGIILSLIALLGIHIGFRPLRRVILYKVFFYVLAGYVFGAALGFLLRVLRVIGWAFLAGCFGALNGFWELRWCLW